MRTWQSRRAGRWGILVALALSLSGPVIMAQESAAIKTITVTVLPRKEGVEVPLLAKDDFSLRLDGQRQEILSVKTPRDGVPLYLALLIQDDVTAKVSNDLDALRAFIRRLPSGSHVMVAYARAGTNEIRQPFTTDLERAAKSLRAPNSTEAAAPGSPYQAVIELLKKFPDESDVRKVMIFVSDGLDLYYGLRDSDPTLNLNLQRAINKAQQRNVVIYAIYAPTVEPIAENILAVGNGQSSLVRLSVETGGEAFFSGRTFVSFQPYLKEIERRLAHQYLITYRATRTTPGFHRLRVMTESPDLRVYVKEGER